MEETSILISFFRIHFARNEDILEDLIPKLNKMDLNSPVPSSIKTILEDSGPAIYLFNRILKNPRHYYQPSELNMQSRCFEMDEFYSILEKAKKEMNNELAFQSLVSAIISFHKNETDYIQIFDFILSITNNTSLAKQLLKLLQNNALHSSFPYIPDDDESDDDFSFDEVSDVDVDLQPRLRIDETPFEVINNIENQKGQNALFLFLGDIIDRNDLLLIEPKLEHSKLNADPVAIDSHNYVTQSIKGGYNKPDYESFDKINYSYVKTTPNLPIKQFTGASSSEEFALNRNYSSLFKFMPPEEAYAPALNVDNDMSLESIYSACQILHDQEIDIDIYYKLAVEISTNLIHTGMIFPLEQIYGIQSEEILDYLKLMPEYTKKIVLETLIKSITKRTSYYYHLQNGVFLLETQESFRVFPHFEYLKDSIDYLKEKSTDKINVINYITKLVDIELLSNNFEPHEIKNYDVNLLTKFSKYYKYFIRKFHPNCYIKPILPLIDSSTDWSLIYEHMISETIKQNGFLQYDSDIVKIDTPVLNNHITKSIEAITSLNLESPLTEPEKEIRKVQLNQIETTLKLEILNPHSY